VCVGSPAQDEKLARREAWEAQLKKLGDRLHVVANSDVALFAAWIDKVAALRESVASEKTTRSRQAEAGLKAIRAVDSSLSEQFAAHSIKRKALFARVQDSLVEPERRVTSTVRGGGDVAESPALRCLQRVTRRVGLTREVETPLPSNHPRCDQRHTQHRNGPPCDAHTTRCTRRTHGPPPS
jgi:hypothetical protein